MKLPNKLLSEKIVNTDKFCGTVDIISGLDDFESQAEFNEEWHTYRVDGKILPSATQLLADDSYKYVDEKILDQARKKGTLIHKEIEMYLKGNLKGYTEEFNEFVGLYTKNKELFSKHGIFDVKTSSVLNKGKTKKQLEMYSEAVEYLTGIKITDLYVIHLPKGKKGRIIKL